MTFTPRSQSTGTFTPRSIASGFFKLVGDMTEDLWVLLLGFVPSFDTPIPQAGGQLLGDLSFEYELDFRALAFTDRNAASGAFSSRTASSASFSARSASSGSFTPRNQS